MKLLDLINVLIPSIIFNFRYLPLAQAIKLPILIRKPKFINLNGAIRLDAESIRFGMIELGFYKSSLYPDNGIVWDHRGLIIFKGRCVIGNNSYVSTRNTGSITFGNNFVSTTSLKIVSCVGITFGENTLIGWENIFMDTNFHKLYNLDNKKFNDPYGEINIGDNNWFAAKCITLPKVSTANNCTFAINSIIKYSCTYKENSIYGGNPIKLVKQNVIKISDNNLINEYLK